MGGFGSGEYERKREKKVRVEECFSIDSFSFAKFPQRETISRCLEFRLAGREMLSVSAEWDGRRWQVWVAKVDDSIDGGDLWTMMKFLITPDTQALFARDIEIAEARKMWKEGKPFTFAFAKVYAPQKILTETSTSPTGASCEFFLCPHFQDGQLCERRCRKLYWRDGSFGCRQCHDLAYTTQNLSQIDSLLERAERFKEKVLVRLPPEEAAEWRDNALMFPNPPKTMTYGQFERLEAEWERCRRKATELMIKPLKR